jgi:List-Bact-rpt repeat protein
MRPYSTNIQPSVTRFSWKWPVLFPVVILAALALCGTANAGNLTRKDGRDSRGALDIASVAHHYTDGATVVHEIRTYKAFASRTLNGDSGAGFMLDLNNDLNPDRMAAIVWYSGRLRGILLNRSAKVLGTFAVSRPNSRTLSAAIPVKLFGAEGRYRWTAFTVYQGKKTCRDSCTDFAPNSGVIAHQLWRLVPFTVGITGSGTVRSTPAGISCNVTCTSKFKQGTTVQLQATPADGYEFTGWSGACTGTGVCEVKLDGAAVVTATFAPTPTLTLTVIGPGNVDVAPPNQRCTAGAPCVYRYSRGNTVTLTLTEGSGVLESWEGACTGTNPVCTLTMDGPKTVTARTRASAPAPATGR